MLKEEVTIAIPVKESPDVVERFISGNAKFLSSFNVYVLNTFGGEALRKHSTLFLDLNLSMIGARRFLIDHVTTKYILNLDVDTVLPENYVSLALKKLVDNVKAVAIDYEKSQGHYAFGTSLWYTDILKKLYDYKGENQICECIHQWRRIHQNGYSLETLPLRAKHLKEK